MQSTSIFPHISGPLWLLAELTYKCPLHCTFCYNPVDYTRYGDDLSTHDWLRVLREGRALGAAQLGFSGGEPLMRDDLEILVAEARRLGYYANLITSGIGLTEKRIHAFKEGGLDHIQLSFQDSTRELNDFISHTRTFDLKSKVAQLIKAHDYPMVLNVVLHRLNIDHVEEILRMADEMGAEYVELANSQYYAWAWENRDHLLPTHEQLQHAEEVTQRFRDKVGKRMKIFFVIPDYYEKRPKACMNGWGSVFMTVAPDGVVLPCHAARMLPGLTFPNVRDASLQSIWHDSAVFNAYRGDAWMKDPCRSCSEKARDFGGCRCQAYLFTQDPANADPVCERSPYHDRVLEAIEHAQQPQKIQEKPILFRDDRNARAFSAANTATAAYPFSEETTVAGEECQLFRNMR